MGGAMIGGALLFVAGGPAALAAGVAAVAAIKGAPLAAQLLRKPGPDQWLLTINDAHAPEERRQAAMQSLWGASEKHPELFSEEAAQTLAEAWVYGNQSWAAAMFSNLIRARPKNEGWELHASCLKVIKRVIIEPTHLALLLQGIQDQYPQQGVAVFRQITDQAGPEWIKKIFREPFGFIPTYINQPLLWDFICADFGEPKGVIRRLLTEAAANEHSSPETEGLFWARFTVGMTERESTHIGWLQETVGVALKRLPPNVPGREEMFTSIRGFLEERMDDNSLAKAELIASFGSQQCIRDVIPYFKERNVRSLIQVASKCPEAEPGDRVRTLKQIATEKKLDEVGDREKTFDRIATEKIFSEEAIVELIRAAAQLECLEDQQDVLCTITDSQRFREARSITALIKLIKTAAANGSVFEAVMNKARKSVASLQPKALLERPFTLSSWPDRKLLLEAMIPGVTLGNLDNDYRADREYYSLWLESFRPIDPDEKPPHPSAREALILLEQFLNHVFERLNPEHYRGEEHTAYGVCFKKMSAVINREHGRLIEIVIALTPPGEVRVDTLRRIASRFPNTTEEPGLAFAEAIRSSGTDLS